MSAQLLAAGCASRFRDGFPVLESTVHLASCSLGARSSALEDALARMLDAIGSGASAWERFEREVERCREGFAALIGADPGQIALLPNASIGAYQVASTLSLGRRGTVVTTDREFPSIAHVWLAQRRRGMRVRFVDTPYDATAQRLAAAYDDAVDATTALVSVPLVTYDHGLLLPVAEIARRAHARGARVFVDAYQAAGVVALDVGELGCDYLVAGAQKYVLGLPGLAFLYVRDGAQGELEPSLTGWFGRVDPFAFDARRLDFAAGARGLETGTPDVAAVYAANAGLGLLATVGAGAVARHVEALGEAARERLAERGERLASPDVRRRGAHLAIRDASPPRLAAWLAERAIHVSPRGSLVRVAFHLYNTDEDVVMLCEAIDEYRAQPAQVTP